jgi:hypothetical protein
MKPQILLAMNKVLLMTLIFACNILPMMAGSGNDKKNGTVPPPMFAMGNHPSP